MQFEEVPALMEKEDGEGQGSINSFDFNSIYEDAICTTAKNVVTEKLMRLASLESAIMSPAFAMLPQDKQGDMKDQWYAAALSLKSNESCERSRE